jgi:hypothetical protein
MLQIVASLTDNSRAAIYDCNMFITQATSKNKLDRFSLPSNYSLD